MSQTAKSNFIRIGAGLALLAIYCVFLVDMSSLEAHIVHADLGCLGLLAIWITLDRMMMSYKWQILVRCRGAVLSFGHALRSYYVATFIGSFLPTTVGGDAVRVGAVRGEELPSSLAAASIVMERVLGFVAAAMTATAALGLLFWRAGKLPTQALEMALAFLALSVGGLLLSLSVWAHRPLQALLRALEARLSSWPWGAKALAWSAKVLEAYGQYRRHGAATTLFLLLSLVEQTAPVVGTWLAALAMHIDLDLLQAAAVVPLAMLCTRVPLSIAGFGVVEGFYMAFFPLVGLSLSDSFLLGLVGDLSVIVATLPGGIVFALGGYRVGGPPPQDGEDGASPVAVRS